MKPTQESTPVPGAPGVSCDVAAYGSVQVTLDGLRQFRQSLTLPDAKPLPPSFLKHSDDQTVAALAAVFQAIERFGLSGTDFKNWGILAAPRFFGRSAMVTALQRFGEEGAWGVSPHLIPHRSLHSVSGTISQALQIHGPNFGIGGGPDCASELFLAVAALLGRERHPGVWVVLSGWQPEPIPSKLAGSTCHAVALALLNAEAGRQGLRLRLTTEPSPVEIDQRISVEALTKALSASPLPALTCWALDGGGRVELEQVGAGVCAFPALERRAG